MECSPVARQLDHTIEQVVELFYALQEGESDDRMDQDILLAILKSADERALLTVLIRLALVTYLREPHPEQPDYLKQAVSVFGLESLKKKSIKNRPATRGKAARSGKMPRAKRGVAR